MLSFLYFISTSIITDVLLVPFSEEKTVFLEKQSVSSPMDTSFFIVPKGDVLETFFLKMLEKANINESFLIFLMKVRVELTNFVEALCQEKDSLFLFFLLKIF